MPSRPILLFLHGVGTRQSDHWRGALEEALTALDYPGLDAARVIAPKYPNTLRGADDDDPLPELTVKTPSGDAARKNRRDFERRMAAVEVMLGRNDRGDGWFGGDAVVDAVVSAPLVFDRAKHYISNRQIRAQVLNRVLRRLPQSGRLVIVGHSLGSVIAADLVRRLPQDLKVVGMVTIGSPLAHSRFNVDKLRATLKEPPTNLGWWVNFWNVTDPVTTHRGVSSAFPWMIDHRIQTDLGPHVHDAETYLANEDVAEAIGFALFGSRSKELAVQDRGVDIRLDYVETLALMALRYGYLTKSRLEADQQDRYAEALRQVQASTVDLIRKRNDLEDRRMPLAIARLAVDVSDPNSQAPEPTSISHLSREEAVTPLVTLATSNIIRPFEIAVSKETQRDAMAHLTLDMGLGSQVGVDVIRASERAQKVLSGGGMNWLKWAAIGLGAAALIAATGGLVLAAAPGLVGAAAITSALAAFGPGGMIGGLLTAGTLLSAGGGGIAVGLASPGTSAETVEAVVASQLTAAILRELQGVEQDPTTWNNLVQTRIEVQRQQTRLQPLCDESAPVLKDFERKLDALDRALDYLSDHHLVPGDASKNEDEE